MVKIVKGNILDATEDIICHQVNCQGVMGSGVAKAIRDKWPKVYEEYKPLCVDHMGSTILGYVQFVELDNDSRIVANLFAQNNYGYDGQRYTSYDAFYKCLTELKRLAKGYSFAFPYKIGSDRGGASWRVIYAMIRDVFRDQNVTIYKLEG